MKSNWQRVPLSEVADLTVGFVGTMAKHYIEDGVPFLRSTNISPFKIDLSDLKYISREFNEKISKSQLNPDDVVIVRTGKPGACAVIPSKPEPWNCSDLVIIRPNKQRIMPLYLASYINLASGVINAHLVGAVQQHFNVGAAKNMIIDVPPIEEQKKICGLIGAIIDKIELNQRINDNLQQQVQILFKEQFLSHDEIPDGWKALTLGDVSEISAGGDKPKRISNQKTEECPYPVYSNGISNEGLYGYTADYKISAESVTVSARGTIGFVCLRRIQYTPIVRLVTLIPHTDIISAKYLYLWLKNVPIHGTGTTQQQLTVPDFRKTEIIIPSAIEMAAFTDTVSPLFQQMWANQDENNKLADIRDTLLPKIMSGEIGVSTMQVKMKSI